MASLFLSCLCFLCHKLFSSFSSPHYSFFAYYTTGYCLCSNHLPIIAYNNKTPFYYKRQCTQTCHELWCQKPMMTYLFPDFLSSQATMHGLRIHIYSIRSMWQFAWEADFEMHFLFLIEMEGEGILLHVPLSCWTGTYWLKLQHWFCSHKATRMLTNK